MLRAVIEILCALLYSLARRGFGAEVTFPDYLMAAASLTFAVLSLGFAFKYHLGLGRAWIGSIVLTTLTVVLTLGGFLTISVLVYDDYSNPIADVIHIWGKYWWVNVYV